MSELLQTTLGDLVAADARRAALFDRLGIDYCCQGGRTLQKACEAKEVDPSIVAATLEALGQAGAQDAPSVDWTERPLGELIDHIVETHHAYLRRELPKLATLFERVASVHGHQSGWLVEAKEVFGRLRLELNSHTESEETSIFPMIRALEGGERPVAAEDAEALLAEAEDEHETAGAALHRLRTLSGDYTPPEWACGSFRSLLDDLAALEADTHRHVHKENSILFPRARRLIENRAPVSS